MIWKKTGHDGGLEVLYTCGFVRLRLDGDVQVSLPAWGVDLQLKSLFFCETWRSSSGISGTHWDRSECGHEHCSGGLI